MSDSTTKKTAEVWLVRETDHFRAGQLLIAIYRGGEPELIESTGFKPAKPVDAVLALAGFKGGETSTLAAKNVRAGDVHFEREQGFAVDEGRVDAIEMEVRKVLGGLTGGFLPLHSQQVSFGCTVIAVLAFEHAWNVAGRPPLMLRPGSFAQDTGGQLLDIHGSAVANPSMLAVRFRHDDEMLDPQGQPIVSGASTEQVLGAKVADRVVPDTKPCPFCSRPMVKINGVFFCVQTLKEQSAASAGQST